MELLSKPNYFAFFKGVELQSKTTRQAWLVTEAHIKECYGCNMYDDFEAFKVDYHRFCRKDYIDPKIKPLLKKKGYFLEFQRLTSEEGLSNEEAWVEIELKIYNELGLYVFVKYGSFRRFLSDYVGKKGYKKESDLFIVRRHYKNRIVSQKLINNQIKFKE